MDTKIKQIISEELEIKISEVTPDAKIQDDLGADSLDIVNLIMALEEELGIDIPDEDAEKLETVNDILLYCLAKTT
jgi:acyl carrier protein